MNQQELSAASSIGLLYMIRMLGLFMVLPVLPLAAPEIEGATPFLIGLAIGIYGLSQGILQIPFGMLSDYLGRKQVIALGLTLFVLGSFVAGQADDIYGLIVGRFMQGCGAIAGTLMALMSDLTRVDQRSRAMAVIGIAIGGSFGLALVLGPLISEGFGIAGIFNITGILGIVGLLLLFWLIPSPRVMSVNLDSTVEGGRLAAVAGDLALWRINISVFCLHFLLVSAFSVFPRMLNAVGEVSGSEHAFHYLVLLLVSIVLVAPFIWLADRVRDIRPILLTMVALCLLSFFLLSGAVAPVYLTIMIAIILFFMAFNLLEVVLPAQLSKLSGAGYRGTSMGVYTSCQFLGIFAGGLVSGWILSNADTAALMYANIALGVLWIGICAGFPRLGRVGSRTIRFTNMRGLSPQESVEALLSVNGVIDAVIIESEQVAYLKVDEQVFEDGYLHQLAETNDDG